MTATKAKWDAARDRATWENQARTDLLERICAWLDSLTACYPADVFPHDGTSKDAIAGTAMRHAYRHAAEGIREEFGQP